MDRPFMRHACIRFVASGIALGSLVACGSQHVMLQTQNTTPGQRFTCNQERGCEPAEVDVPTRDSVPGTTFVMLPDACDGRFHQLVIYEADSGSPQVGVTCALSRGK